MEIIIETCLKDLFVGLIFRNKLIDYILEYDLIKKSDRLPFAFQELIERNKVKTQDIKLFYVTSGPGSFMGIRAGLLFASTIAQVTKSKLKTVNTMHFLSGGKKGKYYLDAKSQKSFYIDYPGSIELINEKHESSKIDYKDFRNNIENYLELFKEIEPSEVEANYLKEPSVG